MSTRERLTVSLPYDLVQRIRTTAGPREVSAYVERAVRHEMLADPYDLSSADGAFAADMEALHDEARSW